MLAQSFEAMLMGVMKLTIQHAIRGMVCFDIMELLKLAVIGYYKVTILYYTLYGREQDDILFG